MEKYTSSFTETVTVRGRDRNIIKETERYMDVDIDIDIDKYGDIYEDGDGDRDTNAD